MSTTTRVMNCTPQAVFDVLTDGWTYATWVVGAARIRKVDDGFPRPGTRVHHSVGFWPFMISDYTEIEDLDSPRSITLRAQAWPAGEGRITITCEGGVGDGDQTLVTMHEVATSGPAKIIPRPIESVLLRLRNLETLKRLGYLAESGARSEHGPHERER
ncbi:MAG TPA: SRPBCC family protein [Nocardioidaceae bacterium]|jgi:hypothetical protein|nr:SRPBCC family protein [Nocardioidaceae bacterium]